MALPNLPYWFHAGRSTTPIKGPVYVLGEDGSVVENAAETVILTPRLRFFASSQAVSHLVRRKLVRPIKHRPVVIEKEPAAPVSKSDPEPVGSGSSTSAPKDPDSAKPSDGVTKEAPGEAGPGESSVPEEKEQPSTRRRRSSRS